MTGWGTGWGQGPGDFRDIPDFLRRIAGEMGFGPPLPRASRPPWAPQPPRGEDDDDSGGAPRSGHRGDRGFERGTDSRDEPGFGGGRRGGPGRGPFGPPSDGPGGPPWARGPRRHRGSRAARGDVRSAILALLAEEPMHGYQMIQEISERSGGRWRPSPGSVYPTLQQLEDEGLVRAEERDGRRVYRLTDQGQEHVAGRAAEFASMWSGMAPDRDEGPSEMGDLVFGVAAAFVHVMRAGSAAQIEQARRVLARTRADLYRILGDGDAAGDTERDTGGDEPDSTAPDAHGADHDDDTDGGPGRR